MSNKEAFKVSGFKYIKSENAGYYVIEKFEETGKVRTCFSTRIGGVSQGEFTSLNLGYKTLDDKRNVDENIRILCNEAGFNLENLVFSDQIHGDNYMIVGYKDRGKGFLKNSDIVGIDALITGDKNTAICIFTADCIPVFLLDPKIGVIALCHAGWRGVVNRIVPKTIKAMVNKFQAEPKNMLGAIGPSIGPCCFKVGKDVADIFKNNFYDIDGIVTEENGEYKVNLWNAVIEQLKSSGLREENIINSRMCTYCNEEMFYSYRRDGAKTGRMISILQLI